MSTYLLSAVLEGRMAPHLQLHMHSRTPSGIELPSLRESGEYDAIPIGIYLINHHIATGMEIFPVYHGWTNAYPIHHSILRIQTIRIPQGSTESPDIRYLHDTDDSFNST